MAEVALNSGTYFGDMTGGGGLAAAFDLDTTQNQTGCATKTGGSATNGYVGAVIASASQFTSFLVYGSQNAGFFSGANPSITIRIYGKSGSNPANSTDGTLLGEITITDTANESAGREITTSDTGTYNRVWARITHNNATSGTYGICELRAFLDAGGTIESRNLTSAGVGAATFIGKIVRAATLSAAGVGAFSGVPKSIVKKTLSAAGVGAFTAVPKSTVRVQLSSAGVASSSLIGKSTVKALLSSTGQATVTFLPLITLQALLTVAGTSTFNPIGITRQTISANLTAAGEGTFSPIGIGRMTISAILNVAGVTVFIPIGDTVGPHTMISLRMRSLWTIHDPHSRRIEKVRFLDENPLAQAAESGIPIPSQPGRRQFPEITSAETKPPAAED